MPDEIKELEMEEEELKNRFGNLTKDAIEALKPEKPAGTFTENEIRQIAYEFSEKKKDNKQNWAIITIALLAIGIAGAIVIKDNYIDKPQPLCDLNKTFYEKVCENSFASTNKMLKDINQNDYALAVLIAQSNYLFQCIIDSNSATTIEVPQADNSYKKYTKFSAVYCPQGGG